MSKRWNDNFKLDLKDMRCEEVWIEVPYFIVVNLYLLRDRAGRCKSNALYIHC
jgi:hypothetical protein